MLKRIIRVIPLKPTKNPYTTHPSFQAITFMWKSLKVVRWISSSRLARKVYDIE